MARALPVVKLVSSSVAIPVVLGRGAVVAAVDRDRDGGRVGAAVAVGDRVGERVGGRFAHSQALELSVGIVGERAVAVVGQSAPGQVVAADIADAGDLGNGQRVAGVGVGVVGQGVAGGEGLVSRPRR